MMIEQGRFACHLCGNVFETAELLEQHNRRLRDPQPTLPSLDFSQEQDLADLA